VVFDQVVTLPVVAVRAAGFGVGERVPRDVGRAVRHPADREGHPGIGILALVICRRGGAGITGLLEQHERELVSTAIVKDVGPVEGLVAERLWHARGEDAEPVPHLGQQALERRHDRRRHLVEDLRQLVGQPAGELRRELRGVRADRRDPLLPLADELAVDLLPDIQ